MAIGDQGIYVTLDTTDGAGGVEPLEPPDWYCAKTNEAGGVVTLMGHYHAGIGLATRVHLKGRTYHVDHVDNEGERDFTLTLTCKEVFD